MYYHSATKKHNYFGFSIFSFCFFLLFLPILKLNALYNYDLWLMENNHNYIFIKQYREYDLVITNLSFCYKEIIQQCFFDN